MEKKRIKILGKGFLLGSILVFHLVAFPGFARGQVKILDPSCVWPQFFSLETETFLPHAQTFHTIDPNFKEEGVTAFTGIRIKKIFDLAGMAGNNGVTLIGSDQYVSFLSKERISAANSILAWQMNEKTIPGLKGGPLKLVFPAEAKVHGSCYTWYVDALIAGSMDQAVLTVNLKGKETLHTLENLISQAQELPRNMVSIPQGCRDDFKAQDPDNPMYALPFSFFVNPGEMEGASRVRLIPLTGSAMTLNPSVFQHPVFILVSSDGKALHPALGGPFSIVFPVGKDPELKGLVPDSGALFFLEKIIVE